MGETSFPLMITQSEYMRRMKDMASINAGMSFYGEMPTMYNVVLNTDHPIIKDILNSEENTCDATVKPIEEELQSLNKSHSDLQESHKDKKEDEIPQGEKDQLADLDKKINETKNKKEQIWSEFAKGNEVVHQLIDLALLQNNMLKGESLNNFVRRSIDLIK